MSDELFLFFDIDGTLISSGGAGKKSLDQAIDKLFGSTNGLGSVKIHGRTDCSILADILNAYQQPHEPEIVGRVFETYLACLREQILTCPGRILPGVIPLLQTLKQQPHVHLGVLTGNHPIGAELKLKHYQLTDYFSFGGYGQDHHDRADVARAAIADAELKLNKKVLPERSWVIGDTPNDIYCARAVGAKVVAVATGDFTREELAEQNPDLLFDDLSNWPELLTHWQAGPR